MAHNDKDKSENKWAGIFTRLFLLLTLIVLLTSLVMFVNWLNRPENFPFKKVELVNRLENQQSRELQQITAKALNGGFFSLDVDEFRAELLDKLPWVKSVSVRKIWPDKLLVEIAEYKPVVRWWSVDFLPVGSLLAEDSLQQQAEVSSSLQQQAEGYLQQQAEGSKQTNAYQLLSQHGVIFEPGLTEGQKVRFNKMALFFGPEMSAKKVLEKCFEINESLKQLGLALKYCGMNKRRTWKLSLTSSGFTQKDGMDMNIKLGKENIMQQLGRFIQVFSGKLKPYLRSVDYADLRYANGFSIKWITDNTLQHTLQNSLQKKVINKPLSK